MEAAPVPVSPIQVWTDLVLSAGWPTLSISFILFVLIGIAYVAGLRQAGQDDSVGRWIWWCCALSAWCFTVGIFSTSFSIVKGCLMIGRGMGRPELLVEHIAATIVKPMITGGISIGGLLAAMSLKLIDPRKGPQ